MITRELLDDVASAAMADRSVDLQEVWRLAARRRRERRRRLVGVSAAALVVAVAAAVVLAGLVPGVRLAQPRPAEVPPGPGAMPSRVGIAPPWTPLATDRPIGRVALVLAGSQQGVASGSETENLAAMERVPPPAAVLVGADPVGGGDQYRLLPDGGRWSPVIAVSPDGAWVAWERTSRFPSGAGRVGVLRARTGQVEDVELPGSWNRGVSVAAVAFSPDGAQLRIRGADRMSRQGYGPERVWAVRLRGDEVGGLGACDCRPDDVPLPLFGDEAEQRTGSLASVELPRELRVVAAAAQVVTAGRLGPVAEPGRWGRDADWYPWAVGKVADPVAGHPWRSAFALLAVAALAGLWRARRAGRGIEALARAVAARSLQWVPHGLPGHWRTGLGLPGLGPAGLGPAGLGLAGLGVLIAVLLGAVGGLGLGLPEPVAHPGGGYVVPQVIDVPPPQLEPAFAREGEPRTTRVALVTYVQDRGLVGLDASTGAWVSLSDLPGVGGPRLWEGDHDPFAVSPNGRFVLRAGFGEDSGDQPSLLVDLETARTTLVDLPFGSDPSLNTNQSQNTAAVMDDGTVALVRHNLGALWLVPPVGAAQELTGLADVRSVSAQPGRFLLVTRPRTYDGEKLERVDLIDVTSGRVWVAAAGIGAPTVMATLSEGAALAWQDDGTGTRPVGLPGRSGKVVRDGTWSSRGGVEALWPSEQGVLVGLGWSEEAPDALLRGDPGIDGSTGLRPFARFGDFGEVSDESGIPVRPWLPVLSVAGSVVAEAEPVEPPSQPWWGRLAWRVIGKI